ncbi:MAG: MoaD/ThiS family protein [Flavobacteriales bacterium]|nr:MoaD/ThiS family protein [Flavobacteriales bacterium]
MNGTITIRYFGQLAEHTGLAEENLRLPKGTSVGALRALLSEKHPTLRDLRYRSAVDSTLCSDEHIIDDCREIALFPPFAGG